MVVNGVAKVADPQGNVRHSLVRQKTRMGFLPVGALLKLSAEPREIVVGPGETFAVPLSIARSEELAETLRLELTSIAPDSSAFTAKPLSLDAGTSSTEFSVKTPDSLEDGEYRLTIRAIVMQKRQYPVVSEATFVVRIRH